MSTHSLFDLAFISKDHKVLLKKGNITTVADLVLSNPQDIARKSKLSHADTKGIINRVYQELAPQGSTLEVLKQSDKFTTGDPTLDATIGGGIRVGMLWEVVGESASGKTQLALQLSLLVQIPPNLGGILGSACYITTNSTLVTKRLTHLMAEHPLLSPSVCSLSDIHTLSITTIPFLVHTLRLKFPALIQDILTRSGRKPLKLLVIDSLAALFHSVGKHNKETLFERSRVLAELSDLMHAIASRHGIAIVILNEVMDVFERSAEVGGLDSGNIIYHKQARWFNRAHTIPGEDRKEASLGLVWANQVNVRIMLSRTGRRRYMQTDLQVSKRRRLDEASSVDNAHEVGQPTEIVQPTLVRRLSVVFSPVSLPASVDFIVTARGISVLGEDTADSPPIIPNNGREGADVYRHDPPSEVHRAVAKEIGPKSDDVAGTMFNRDGDFIEIGRSSPTIAASSDEHCEVAYWEEFENDLDEAYLKFDFDALDERNIKADL